MRALLKGRWLVGHVIIVAISVGMIWLGFWQLDRLHEVKDDNRDARATIGSPPRALESASAPGLANYLPVTVAGRLLSETTVFKGYPIRDGRPGFEVVQVMELRDGSRMAVNLGWIPQEAGAPLARPSAGPQEVTVTGLLRRPERSSAGNSTNQGSPAIPVIKGVSPDRLNGVAGMTVAPMWLQASTPVAGPGNPQPLPPPSLDEGPHLSYALQWFSFTAIALLGWGALCARAVRN